MTGVSPRARRPHRSFLKHILRLQVACGGREAPPRRPVFVAAAGPPRVSSCSRPLGSATSRSLRAPRAVLCPAARPLTRLTRSAAARPFVPATGTREACSSPRTQDRPAALLIQKEPPSPRDGEDTTRSQAPPGTSPRLASPPETDADAGLQGNEGLVVRGPGAGERSPRARLWPRGRTRAGPFPLPGVVGPSGLSPCSHRALCLARPVPGLAANPLPSCNSLLKSPSPGPSLDR
ncbi:hypothetical protein AAY473_018073 [Plecturocebus cupreus]